MVVNSNDTATAVQTTLGVDANRIVVCRPGLPAWIGEPLDRVPPQDGYVLFVGTLEPRKNLGALLDAWEHLLEEKQSAAAAADCRRHATGIRGMGGAAVASAAS